ncbi:MAG: hypothetical protein LBT78_06245 [Tannerella sp.]|jgi:C-terminal processing protease CtpA/Prc|nr:hypothetical protein [Tannerella sp.]
MKANKLKLFLFLCGGLFLLFPSCSEEGNDLIEPDDSTSISKITVKVNRFIANYMKELYLWTSTVDWNTVNPETEPDSFDFFNKLVYEEEDVWSSLTENIQELTSEFEGVSTTFGYRLVLGRFINSENLFAIVLYVYPGTPADLAGMKRGDILLSINETPITEANYSDLYDASSLRIGKGIDTGEGIAEDSAPPYSLTAQSMYENPIIKDTVIVKGANKIGYLCYADYTPESERELLAVFSRFKSGGVTDVVLDLRYNGGGYMHTANVLSSILAPSPVVKRKDIFLSAVWNDARMAYYKRNKIEVDEYFTDTLSVNMNLNRVFILATGRTASASESTIIGLEPYMEVIRIGSTTYGKYCGGLLLSDENDEDIANWGMYLMLYRFANKNGATSFTGGLAPDIEAKEDYDFLYPFGDERDPLLGTAIGEITGQPYVQTRSGKSSVPFYPDRSLERRGALHGKMIDTRPLPFISNKPE